MKNLEKFLMIFYHLCNGLGELCWNGSELLRVWREGKEPVEETVEKPKKKKKKPSLRSAASTRIFNFYGSGKRES